MTVLLHISDTHFGTEQPPVVEALLHAAREQQPDLVVHSGDVTQRARRKQFEAARRFVERLGAVPTLVIHGSEDPLVPVEAGQHTASLVRDAELMIIDGMGHDYPSEVVPAIADRIIQHCRKADHN